MPSLEFRRVRSEEHTSELQSHSHLVCRLLLEKKKNERLRWHRRASVHSTSADSLSVRAVPSRTLIARVPSVVILTSSYTLLFFFLNDTATTEIYPLSLHAALPICLNSSHTLISYAVFSLRDESVTGVQ